MDEIVRRAMAKWPDVPAVFGWLALDRRGQWLIKDERVSNALMTDFINRNYAHDPHGRWFFQNGPQRVFVTLAYTPWVLRIGGDGMFNTHTNQPVRHLTGGWIDEQGIVLLATEHGAAMVDDRDVEALSCRIADSRGNPLDEDALLVALERLQAGEEVGLVLRYSGQVVALRPIAGKEVSDCLGFVANPQPLAGASLGT